MPELPEVETMRRGILGFVGHKLLAVERLRCASKPILVAPGLATFRRRAVGRDITAIERVGKRVVLRLDSEDAIVIEPRMTGLVLLSDPPDPEHLRMRFVTEAAARRSTRKREADAFYYWDRRGLGSVRLVRPEEFVERYGEHKLGPDALAISSDELQRRLSLSRRAVKPALLDQRVLAGVGNLYASEMLFLAGIDPRRSCGSLSRGEWRRLHQAMLEVLHAAIRAEGSTLSDGTYRNALNHKGGYQNHHRVYDRAGEPCFSCGELIARIVQTQRATFFCPGCQQYRKQRH